MNAVAETKTPVDPHSVPFFPHASQRVQVAGLSLLGPDWKEVQNPSDLQSPCYVMDAFSVLQDGTNFNVFLRDEQKHVLGVSYSSPELAINGKKSTPGSKTSAFVKGPGPALAAAIAPARPTTKSRPPPPAGNVAARPAGEEQGILLKCTNRKIFTKSCLTSIPPRSGRRAPAWYHRGFYRQYSKYEKLACSASKSISWSPARQKNIWLMTKWLFALWSIIWSCAVNIKHLRLTMLFSCWRRKIRSPHLDIQFLFL